MTTLLRSTIPFFLSILFLSCASDSDAAADPSTTAAVIADYFPMTKGSYWIYHVYEVDTLFQPTGGGLYQTESLYVAGDTVIRSATYARMSEAVWNGSFCLRDSSGYLVTDRGEKVLSLKTNGEVLTSRIIGLPDSLFLQTTTMLLQDSLCTVPAGAFQARYMVGTVRTLVEYPSVPSMRRMLFAFAKDAGLVFRRDPEYQYPVYREHRLVRYRVNKP